MTLTTNDATPKPTTSSNNPYFLPLTGAVIKRARQGLRAGRDPNARASIGATITNMQRIVQGANDYRVDGKWRYCFLNIFIHTLFRVTIEFPENIPTTPVILAPNHLNHIDPFLVLSAVPAYPYYYVIGDARTMYNRLWKRIFVRIIGGVIPVDRLWKEESAVIKAAQNGEADLNPLAEAIKQDVPGGNSIEVLRKMDSIVHEIFARGDSLLIFPEGMLGPREGALRPLKKGTVIYAMRVGAPIVPVALIGTRDLFLRKRLTIRFGKPLLFPQNAHPRLSETQAALQELQEAMQALQPENYRESNGIKLFRWLLNRMFL